MQLNHEDVNISTFSTLNSNWASNNVGIQLIHIPSGIMVKCSDQRSQHANLFKAMKELTPMVETAPEPNEYIANLRSQPFEDLVQTIALINEAWAHIEVALSTPEQYLNTINGALFRAGNPHG